MVNEQRLLNYGLEMGADLSTCQYCAVMVDELGKVVPARAGKNADGILQDMPSMAGQMGTVALFGVSRALASSNGFRAGELLEVSDGGRLQKANTGTVVAKALATAEPGNFGTVLILKSNAAYW
ncbi:MAG: hypothetical protein ABSC23_20050 [Bryobacteraceae bacterium]